MRHLSAEDCKHLLTLASDIQRPNVMVHQFGICLAAYAIIAFITRHKRCQITDHTDCVHIIQGRQMIKMQNMRLQKIGTENQGAEQLAVIRNFIV